MAIEVIELSEDGDTWLVTGVSGMGAKNRGDNAKAEIDKWLASNLSGDDLAESRDTLAAAKATPFIGWFATGHREGELVSSREMKPPRSIVGVLVR